MAEQQLQEKLKEVKAKIKANSKDAHFADALIDELVGLQKQADVEPVELIVPLREVIHTRQIDDVTSLSKTVHGYLYKHGNVSATWIPFGMNTLYNAVAEIDEILEKEDRTDDEQTTVLMVNRMLQWHTVAFLDAETLVDSAMAAMKIVKDASARYNITDNKPETEDDVEANTLYRDASEALDTLKGQ